jgi:alpha-mannosidase
MTQASIQRRDALYLQKVKDRIAEIKARYIYPVCEAITDVTVAETMEHLSISEAKKLRYTPAEPGFQWGKNWGTAWFRLRFSIPKSMKGRHVRLLFDLENSECLIFRNGEPVQGLCWTRKEYMLFEKAAGGERIELYVEAGANARLGAFEVRTMHQPHVALCNRDVWDAYWDLSALFDMIDPEIHCDWLGKPYLPPREGDPRSAQIAFALNEAVDLFDYDNPSDGELTRQARAVRKRLAPILDAKAGGAAPIMATMGHAHLDVAWKWPLAESIRKSGRTFSNVLEIMEEYPDFLFLQGQPHLYEFVRDTYPSLYRRMKKRIKSGQWIADGAMWVEPDCNIPSGESLVRQILFGTRFFREEFGVESKVLWLPDVFGYSAALPQILKRSGIDYFFTAKLALNQFVKFPYNSFHWEGIDGSQVLAHYMPAEEYSSKLEPWLIRSGAHDYTERDRSPIQALPFGHGDGGGGPARPQLERHRRYEDVDGLPRLEYMSPLSFFERLAAESKDLPTWLGEMYLELHRGCYTSQGLVKRNNRKAEILLREAELWATIALTVGARYDQKALNAAWKTLLLNQFHDILPGSSIDEVYHDSESQFAELFASVGAILERAMRSITRHVDVEKHGSPVLALNSLGWAREDTVVVSDFTMDLKGKKNVKNAGGRTGGFVARDAEGNAAPAQVGVDGKLRFRASLPSMGYGVFYLENAETPSIDSARETGLENDRLKLTFDKTGRLRRIFDKKHRREVLTPKATGNQFTLFEDKMASTGDSWDLDMYYEDKRLVIDGELLSSEIVEHGPVRTVLRQVRAISRSTIRQDIILTSGSARIDFETTVEWGAENNVLLKVAFPVAVRSEKARYEIQYGSIERPTHRNMPQDFARFEVPAHKWADLSEGNYGVALLNDCKYGYDVHQNVLRLSLLRATTNPGLNADVLQTHVFTYSLLPHGGDFTDGLVRAGYALNAPALARAVRPRRPKRVLPPSFLSVDGENVVIDTVKKAENGNGIVVRLFESHGWQSDHVLKLPEGIRRVVETNLVERDEKELRASSNRVSLDFAPFQVRTLRLLL